MITTNNNKNKINYASALFTKERMQAITRNTIIITNVIIISVHSFNVLLWLTTLFLCYTVEA